MSTTIEVGFGFGPVRPRSTPPGAVTFQASQARADTAQMAKKKAKSKEKSAAQTKVPRLYRDATTGRFVTKKYARKNAKSTVKERRRIALRTDSTSPLA